MITQTNQTLRDLYLRDLQLPDIHHGRTTAKVRNIEHWKAIEPRIVNLQWDAIYAPDGRRVFVWSDIHFGHKNIITYTGRPFYDVTAMNASMIANYKAVIKEDDIVIFGGDISFMSEALTNDILHQLPGHKIQIVGNHDIDRKGNLTNMHFDERHLCLVVTDNQSGIQLLFTHYPMDKVPKNCVNVHGHIHNHLANPWNINICVEHTNYSPISLDGIVARAKEYLA